MSFVDSLSSLGLGYAIAIALGFLVLLASLLLASYFCFRRGVGSAASEGTVHSGRHAASSASSSGHISITVPRFVFVAEDDSPGSSSRGAGAAAASSPVGLDPAVIASFPKTPFSRAAAGANAEAACSICLCEYREGEMQRVMPECRHAFHLMCLDAWLRRSASCPVCRSSPIPTPAATPLSELATPLSELVPLSQYAADRRRRR
ncbi:RING-H2 finger protein ATL67-like [Brachypodium distachyon]|uniref:RING-H2 finger protein ATL67-like n=1 Tax=Brachypodium distachyon TaxID=15368 RepID=UPI0001C71C49|nr:RING-H2 finger protein ATL67-like [Brachypodium distachyon]|eukprot:XP_014753834.1 RING-H2 finger protein ATL67-like [Brachypodium distachyon]